MKHIESSLKISGTTPADIPAIKYSLVERLKNAFHVETVGENNENFSIHAMGKSTSYVFTLHVHIKSDGNNARIMIDGHNEVSMATRIFYVVSLLMVLGLSLFPSDTGTPHMILVAIFFLVAGGFIIHDMHKKFEEPQILIDKIMTSIGVEFG